MPKAKIAPLVTKESLAAMLANANPQRRIDIIGRALVVLFERQTESERRSDATNDHNGVGFAGCDAKGGSLTAKSYLARKTLVDWQVQQWMRPSNGFPRICKYAKQLNQAAMDKAERKAGLAAQEQRELV